MSKEDSSSSKTGSSGIGFVGLLTIVFITLKLLDHINWSWIWVLSPLWISFATVIAVLLVCLVIWLAAEGVLSRNKAKK